MLCDDCAEMVERRRVVELPVADDDTWTVPPVSRPARLAPDHREPAWSHNKVATVEVHPADIEAEQALRELGYTQTAEMKDPHGKVVSHVWAKVMDDGC